MNHNRIHQVTLLGMCCAIALLSVALIRIPLLLPFLTYSPKDVIITLSGFFLGPFAALSLSFITSVLEMLTVSDTGILGCIMNTIASASFACAVITVFHHHPSRKGLFFALCGGTLLLTISMILWNIWITPLYMGCSRAAVLQLIVPAILPFNLLKGGLNSLFIFLLYHSLKTIMQQHLEATYNTSLNEWATSETHLLLGVICLIFLLALIGIACFS